MGFLSKLLVTGFTEPEPHITIWNAAKARDWKVYMKSIIRVYRDKETDLCVIECIDDYIWTYETIEEVCLMIADRGGIR